MCRPCMYTAHVYRDDVTLNLGRYYIYDETRLRSHENKQERVVDFLTTQIDYEGSSYRIVPSEGNLTVNGPSSLCYKSI
jgi:hypothetical protein